MELQELHAFGKHAVSAEWIKARMGEEGKGPAGDFADIHTRAKAEYGVRSPQARATRADLREGIGQVRKIRQAKAKRKDVIAKAQEVVSDYRAQNKIRKSDEAAKKVRDVLEGSPDTKIRKLKSEIATTKEVVAKKVRKFNRTSRRLGTAGKVLTGTAAVLGLGFGAKKLYDATREPTVKKKMVGTAKAGLEMRRDARDLRRVVS